MKIQKIRLSEIFTNEKLINAVKYIIINDIKYENEDYKGNDKVIELKFTKK